MLQTRESTVLRCRYVITEVTRIKMNVTQYICAEIANPRISSTVRSAIAFKKKSVRDLPASISTIDVTQPFRRPALASSSPPLSETFESHRITKRLRANVSMTHTLSKN